MLDLDNPFWRFSLAVYGEPGVQAECLAAQDKHGADVNVLLFCAWLGAAHGIALDTGAIARIEAAVTSWSGTAVLPLRQVRRAVKTLPEMQEPAVQALREAIAAAEFEAERIEQALLFGLTVGDAARSPPREDAGLVAANLTAYLAGLDRNMDAPSEGLTAPMHLIAAAVEVAGRANSTPPGA